MSENVDLVRSILAKWVRGDYSSTVWADPEIEFVYPDGPSPATWKGLDGLAAGSRDWLNAWADFRFVVDRFQELDAQRVLVLVRYSGRGKASGVDVGTIGAQGAQLFYLHNGKVRRFVRYLNRERALADLGLAPEAGLPDS